MVTPPARIPPESAAARASKIGSSSGLPSVRRDESRAPTRIQGRSNRAAPAWFQAGPDGLPRGNTTFDELDSLPSVLPESKPTAAAPMALPGAQLADEIILDGAVGPLEEFGSGTEMGGSYRVGFPCGIGMHLLRCRVYGAGEILALWTKGLDVPPLVTTSPVGTPRDQIGVLGDPGTTILFGGEGINHGGRGAGRATLGYWLNPDRGLAIESVYTFSSDVSTDFQAASPGTPVLARPFRNTTTGQQDAVQLAIPGELDGNVTIHAHTEFQAFDVRLRKTVADQCNILVDFLVGYRFAQLDDQLTIADSTTTLVAFPPPLPIVAAGTNLAGRDQFETTNRFNGAEFGFACELDCCPWTWELMLNLGIGNTHSEVFIDGSTTTTTPGAAPVNQAGSKLALPSNMGRFQQDSFSVVPEVGLRLGYDFAPRWRCSVAYTLLYWSHVARAGNQIDLDIDENQFPVPNAAAGAGLWPEFRFTFDDFWAQGVGLKLEHLF